MYKYYCKDSNCQGHTKSWERCCDMRAFSAQETTKKSPFQTAPLFSRTATATTPFRKQVFA
ncbi:hypothetical protein OAN24_01170 [Pseudodesulfovibrio sp.]|nr:hypothetical protein [Pseudodesulfovibrio sp.]